MVIGAIGAAVGWLIMKAMVKERRAEGEKQWARSLTPLIAPST
jgi:hypothetical protein